jgi:hypothetical protein
MSLTQSRAVAPELLQVEVSEEVVVDVSTREAREVRHGLEEMLCSSTYRFSMRDVRDVWTNNTFSLQHSETVPLGP